MIEYLRLLPTAVENDEETLLLHKSPCGCEWQYGLLYDYKSSLACKKKKKEHCGKELVAIDLVFFKACDRHKPHQKLLEEWVCLQPDQTFRDLLPDEL